MKLRLLCLTGAALLALVAAAHAQSASPQDSLAASPDSAAAQPDTVATPAPASAPVPAAAPATVAPATTSPATTTPPPASAPATASTASSQSGLLSRMYFGGSVGFSFWSDYTRISLEPFAALKLSPKLSVGGKLRYEYLNDKRAVVDYTSNNFGVSVLSNYRLLRAVYAHGEAALMNYDYPSGSETVPFLLVGGGYIKPMRKNMSAYVEVLWDLLNDSHSPYEEWQPVVSVGVSAGF